MDSRRSSDELFQAYETLVSEGWERHEIYQPGEGSAPAITLTTETKGKALWVIAGIHGEEPAGPNAIAQNMDIFRRLASLQVPMVLMPLCNPVGYDNNWRFVVNPDVIAEDEGAADKLIVSHRDALFSAVSDLAQNHPPALVFDHHEDDDFPGPHGSRYYLFSSGRRGRNDPVVGELKSHLNAGLKLDHNFNGQIGSAIIRGGVVGKVADGSIDELIGSREGQNAPHVIVVETDTRHGDPLEVRMEVHTLVMQQYEALWRQAVELR